MRENTGEKILSLIRVTYNKILYYILGLFSIFIPKLTVFPNTNGDCITLAWGENIYKFYSLFFLTNPNRSFSRFQEIHKTLFKSGIRNIPEFSIGRLYIKYRFIKSKDLLNFLKDANSETKVRVMKKVLSEIRVWHEKGFAHLDFKPKNILIDSSEQVYFIDFENTAYVTDPNTFLIDFEKLVPRIVYLFNQNEFTEIIQSSSHKFKLIAEKYVKDFNYRDILKDVSGVVYEKEEYDAGEDVDITVNSFEDVPKILEKIRLQNLDYFLFFRSRDDIKLYVFNLKKLILIDIHFDRPISKILFLYQKLKKHPVTQVSLTGPDGVGKTTFLSQLTKESLFGVDFEVIHAGRFIQGQSVFWKPFNILERIGNKLALQSFSPLVLYRRFLRRNVKPIIITDRSFYDAFVDRHGKFKMLHFLWLRNFIPRKIKIILILDNPQAIVERKNELTIEQVEKYYIYTKKYFPIYASITNQDQDETVYKVSSLLKYLRFTPKNFL